MAMSITDQLVHTTVRIECETFDRRTSSGTGFVINFCTDGNQTVPAIITNKHVIAGAKTGVFHMTLKDNNDAPIYGQHIPVPVQDFETLWIKHPDNNVDIAAFPLAPVVRWLQAEGKRVFYIALATEFIADAAYMKELSAVEDILMIGYPNGLWDSRNNLPIARRGVTATPPYIDFEGRPEFMIDCACFPGSSGSPIVLFNIGGHTTKDGGVVIGPSRLKLLGILWGGPQYTAEGQIKVVPVPVAMQPIALSRIPNNLGFCVKAEQLLWFESHFGEVRAAEKKVLDSQKIGAPV